MIVSVLDVGRRTVTTEPLYRYDQNVDLRLINIPAELEDKIVCEFFKEGDTKASHPTRPVDGKVRIPNEMLRDAKSEIHCYITVHGAPAFQTIREIIVPIRNRPRPGGREVLN